MIYKMASSVHVSCDVLTLVVPGALKTVDYTTTVVISLTSRSHLLFCRIRMLLTKLTCHNVQGLIASSLSASTVGQSGSSAYMRLETNDLADYRKVATHTTTTPGPNSPVISNIPECPNQPMHFLDGNSNRNSDASNSERKRL